MALGADEIVSDLASLWMDFPQQAIVAKTQGNEQNHEDGTEAGQNGRRCLTWSIVASVTEKNVKVQFTLISY